MCPYVQMGEVCPNATFQQANKALTHQPEPQKVLVIQFIANINVKERKNQDQFQFVPSQENRLKTL
jgi:hypothetical protein